MFKGNHYLTGNNDRIIPKNFDLAWKFFAGSHIFYSVASDYRVYLTTLAKKLISLDLYTGEVLWEKKLNYPVIRMPVIYKKYLLLAAGRYLYCFNKWSGTIIWSRKFLGFSQLSTPIVENDVIYYGNRGAFFARNIKNGSLVWQNDNIMSYGGSPIYASGRIYTQHRNYNLMLYYFVCIDAYSGEILWRKKIPRDANIFTPIVYNNSVYLVSSFSLMVFNSLNGSLIKVKRFGSRFGSSPVLVNNSLYISTTKGEILKLNTHNLKIKSRFSHFRKQGNKFSNIGPWLYLSDSAGNIFEVNKDDGKINRRFATGKNQTHSFPLIFSGRILLPARKNLFCIGKYPPKKEKKIKRGGIRFVFYNYNTRDLLKGNVRIIWARNERWDSVIKKMDNGRVTLIDRLMFPASFTFEKKGFLFLTKKIKQQKKDEIKIFLKPVKKGTILVFRNILFNTDSSGLLPDSLPVLKKILNFLKYNPKIVIGIYGHTDNIGSKIYNKVLSLQRARVVRDFLIKNNITFSRIKIKGYGSSRPVASNKTIHGRKLNRRTEIKILDYKK